MTAYYDNKPSAMEAVGNGSRLYRWDIEEVDAPARGDGESAGRQWKCEEATVWEPVTYQKVVEAVIRSRYTESEELSIVNKYNAYQQGLDTAGAEAVGEYTEYLSFVAGVKRRARLDLGEEETSPATAPATLTPRLADIARLLSLTVNTMGLADSDALKVKSVYPDWSSLVGKEVRKDEKMQCDGKLWKALQDHTAQEQWKPGEGTESLYAEIVESHAGTADDPIPYDGNMELESGKYYSQGGKTYRCVRDTGQPVYNALEELVGLYVEEP